MKTLALRTISGIVLVGLILASVLIHSYAVGLLFLVFTILTLSEYNRLLFRSKWISKSNPWIIAMGSLCYILLSLISLEILDMINVVFIFLLLLLFMTVELFRDSGQAFRNSAFSVFGLIYIVLPFVLINYLHFHYSILLYFFLILWANDVFAYLTGSLIGKHPLYKKISPKKTWEGTIGGLILAIGAAWLASSFSDQLLLVEWLGFGLIVSVSAILGDLIESKFKREMDVKDSGSIMPGHGGLLDRFDAMFFAAPAVFVYLSLI